MTPAVPHARLITHLHWPAPGPAEAAARARWQATYSRAVAAAPGFLALDLQAEDGTDAAWRLVERFATGAARDAWQGDAARAALLAEAAAAGATQAAAPPPADTAGEPATEVIISRLRRGGEAGFLDWCARIQAVQGSFPGYRGTIIQAPAAGGPPDWTTCVRFDTPAHLDAWLAAPDRAALLRDQDRFVQHWRHGRLPASFAAWFPAIGADAPPLWKQASLVLLVLFPVVMLEMRFLSPWLAGLPPALATFLGNALSVGLVTWPLMPLAVLLMGWWLRPRDRRAAILGLLVLGALYAAEIALLSRL